VTNEKLKPGEKYLTILLFGKIKITAFPIKDRTGNQPHFRGDGVTVWVNEKQEQQSTGTTEESVL